MKKTNAKNFSTWTLWSPLKFALISFGIMITTAFIYSLIASIIYTPVTMPQAPLVTLLSIGFIGAIAIQIKSLPREKMDRTSFVAIHNTQTTILSVLFIAGSYLIVKYAQPILFYLLTMGSNISGTFIIALTASLLFYLYLLGLLFANIYAKFRRARELNIPTWKIICSMPFGFAALWTPGYILDYGATKTPTYIPKSKHITNAMNWVVSRPTHTIATFIAITLLSGFFFGFNAVLLTFSLTLIFGIWALQRGTKNFIKSIPGKYTNTAIIFNIALIILFIGFYAFIPKATQDVQLTISDTEIIETQQQ